jgi:hypothetical protein
VTRRDTGEPPIFLGPALLHGDSTFETYQAFFSEISAKLDASKITTLAIGNDDEKAMRKAMRVSFPNAQHTICTRHLMINVRDAIDSEIADTTRMKELLSMNLTLVRRR